MFQQTGYRLVSDFASFPRFLREQVVDEVVIALPMQSSYVEAARITALCEEQGIIVRMLSDMFNLRLAHSRADEFEGVPVTTLANGSPDGWPHLCKRTLDIAVSLAAMVALAPHRELMSLAVPDLEILSRREQLRASLIGWLPWVGKGSLAILDQGLFASSNFLLNVLLARWLAPGDYGAFALAYSVFLLLGVLHSALLTGPMLVFGPGKYRERFPEYLGILLRGHFALMLPGAALLAVVAFLLGWAYSPAVERAFLALAIAGPFLLLLWLLRRAFYVRLNPGWSAVGGGLYLLILLASALALRAAGRLTPATGFLTMAAASLIASLVLLVLLRPTLATDSSAIRAVAADHWRYGKWVAATAGPDWFSSNIYFIVLPAWVGLAEAGALKALLNLAMPALHTIGALGVLLVPILVRDRDCGGRRAMKRTVKLCLALFLLGSACYLALLCGFRLQIFHFLYAGKYAAYASWPLLLVGLLPFAQSLPIVMAGALGALEQPRLVFWSCVGSGAVALALGVPLASSLGVGGSLVGLILSSAVLGGSMVFFYWNIKAAPHSFETSRQR
jgi:O-antigen/teichoic acid export membrane protein